MTTASITKITIAPTNARIVGFGQHPWSADKVVIETDGGVFQTLDKRCVNTQSPQPGQRGHLEYREYEFGFRWFFDVVNCEKSNTGDSDRKDYSAISG